jgi:hypothetical protein
MSAERQRATAIAALTADARSLGSSATAPRMSPAELERQLLSELTLFDEMGEMVNPKPQALNPKP